MNENIKKVVANPQVVLREEFENSAVLFDPETGSIYGLNPIGVIVWKHLDGLHTIDDIAHIVCEKADAVPADAASHIENFFKAAIELGLAGFKDK